MAQIDGGPGPDMLQGDDADDQMFGYGGDDELRGGGGDDTLDGGDGEDKLYGEAGDDTIVSQGAGRGDDTERVFEEIYGGSGDDIVTILSPTYVRADGGEDIDRLEIDFRNSDFQIIGEDDQFLWGLVSLRLPFSNFEFVEVDLNPAEEYAIDFPSSPVNFTFRGGGPNGHVRTGSGNDVLAVLGDMYGGAGDDIYHAGGTVHEDPDDGDDTVISDVTYQLDANVEILRLIGTAPINGRGNALDNVIYGNGNDNWLNGGGGVDTFKGGDGNDTYTVNQEGETIVERAGGGSDTVRSQVSFSLPDNVENLELLGSASTGTGNERANVITGNTSANILEGRQGNDTLDGGRGSDRMIGGYGNDSYYVDSPGDRVIEGPGKGTDTVFSSIGYALGTHVENLTLTGLSRIDGTGNGSANVITGNGSANVLRGGGGADRLDGGGGADRLYGGDGDDVLNGGRGFNAFYFDTAPGPGNVDFIESFSTSGDTIFLSRAVFTGIAANGVLDPSAFRAGPSALDADDRILYHQATGRIFYDADGQGGTPAILFAEVDPGLALTHADFVGYI